MPYMKCHDIGMHASGSWIEWSEDDEQMKNGPKMWNQLSNFAAPLPGSLQAAGMADLYSKIGKELLCSLRIVFLKHSVSFIETN